MLSILLDVLKRPGKLQQQGPKPVSLMEWIDPVAEFHFVLLGVCGPLMRKGAMKHRSELEPGIVGHSTNPGFRG